MLLAGGSLLSKLSMQNQTELRTLDVSNTKLKNLETLEMPDIINLYINHSIIDCVDLRLHSYLSLLVFSFGQLFHVSHDVDLFFNDVSVPSIPV